eukprot:3831449-Pyramimonas_sp.AAC.1
METSALVRRDARRQAPLLQWPQFRHVVPVLCARYQRLHRIHRNLWQFFIGTSVRVPQVPRITQLQ